MSEKVRENAIVISQEEMAPGIFSMWIKTGIADYARAGQFISVYTKDSAKLLPRPISICDTKEGQIRIVYRLAGEGTKEFSSYKEGDSISVLGPLGNGYDIDSAKTVLIMGGGIGIPPMLKLSKTLNCEKKIVLGYRDSNLFLKDEFEKEGDVYLATEDGSAGTKGNVLDAVRQEGIKADVICACGPMPMLRAISRYAKENDIEAYVSLEERMACGVGACLGCVCKTKEKDGHSLVNNSRICKDGPVFRASDLDI